MVQAYYEVSGLIVLEIIMPYLSGFLLTAFVLMLALTGPLIAGNPNIIIGYDQQRDEISIQAENASLTTVLSDIAKKTRITIHIDPVVEKTVNFQLPRQPLQQALQKIVKGLSYIIEYSTNEQERVVVSGLRILPKGKQDSGQLVPVSTLNAQTSFSDKARKNISGGSLNRRGNFYPGGR